MTYGTGMKMAVAAMAAVALLGVSACGKKDTPANTSANGNAEVGSSSNSVTPTTRVTTGTTPGNTFSGDTLQWATTAKATTSYGDTPDASWSEHQATGAPDVTGPTPADECGDIGQAWASAGHDTVDTITLGYTKAVIPTGINIRETYNPGAIVTVVVSGPDGQKATIYQGQPTKVTTCPRLYPVPVTGVDFAVNTVAITIDQSQVQSWAEIDAVQLVGNLPKGSSGSGTSSTTAYAVTTTTVAP